jgi:hypothetical protein
MTEEQRIAAASDPVRDLLWNAVTTPNGWVILIATAMGITLILTVLYVSKK